MAKCAWVERSDRFSADNYRAELLGALALQQLCQIAVGDQYFSLGMRPQMGCDNKATIQHVNRHYQPQADYSITSLV